MKTLAWYTKLSLALTAFVPFYFIVAALGTKVGLWGWMTGLVGMTFTGGPFVLGIAFVVALIVVIIGLINWSGRKAEKTDGVKRPRSKMVMGVGILGMIVPVAFVLFGLTAASKADGNPIHDIATDTANPPMFSAEVLAEREAAGANPVNDYQKPLSEIEMFKGAPPELAILSHAQIINDTYPELSPLPLGGASRADAVAAVAAAMGSMGFTDIRQNAEEGRVEGVAETFWFGFKDDVVARIGEAEIDFRSVSRVGQSDLGANAARIATLREKVATQIGQR
ncbi:DUF1499 domain-containing protein [Erythrobacter sp. SCSIO 43205]|uniref:DUF1499 domain-containing protein n=1 Tax=Erythrobacter sp. SCSIO 43205 TaxID=2779361 RepID=UPI001CA9CF3C|nr:DUF1499 domain-containing protein [Erythrobacter sp. SCSIO 43205]UAB78025.1 DUF1499 domain-containing protein [Erythrobacter sp. SCSIO 43205]